MPLKIRVPQKKETIHQKVTDRYDLLKEQILNQPKFISIVVILLVLISASLGGFWLFIRQSEKKAWALALEASKILDQESSQASEGTDKEKEEARQEKLRKAAKLYEEILIKYPASRAAVVSQYKEGHVYFELGDYKLAEEKYKTFLKKQTSEKELLPLVHLKLAYLYQKKGDTTAALEHLRIVYNWGNGTGEEKGLNQDQAGFELARFLEQIGKKSESIDIYKKVEEGFSDSPWGMEAKGRLALLEPDPKAVITPSAEAAPLNTAESMPNLPAPMAPDPEKITQKAPPSVRSPQLNLRKEAPPSQPTAITTPSAPAETRSTPVPLEITPEQLRLLHEKGSLTIPLPKESERTEIAPKTEVAPPLEPEKPKKEPEPVP